MKWTPEKVEALVLALGQYPRSEMDKALQHASSLIGERVTYESAKGALRKGGLGAPGSFCQVDLDVDISDLADDKPVRDDFASDPDLTERILAALRYRPLDYVALSDKLNVPTDEVKRTVQGAIKCGYDLCINDGNVSRKALLGTVKRNDVAGWGDRDGRHLVGIVSDTHIGNTWSAEEELTRFIRYLYGLGCRTIIHPGDVLDGVDDKLIPEQYLVGFDRQSLQATRTFPTLKGLRYFAQTGNHDEYTSTKCGMDAGRTLENRFREVGRDDWHHVGRCGSTIQVESARWELLHPHGGTGSSAGVLGVLEKHVDERATLPHFMITGHFHKYCTGIRKGCHMIGCATWQRKGSPFSNRIAGPWAVGGIVVDYNVDQDGRVDDVSTRFVSSDRFAVAA